MKRLALIAALALAVSGSAFAQQATPTPDTQTTAPVVKKHAANPNKESARMAKELNLTPDQAAKVEPILADRDAKVATINTDSTLTSDERAQKLKEVRKGTQSKLGEVLTPDQMKQMKEMRKKAPATPDAPPPPAA